MPLVEFLAMIEYYINNFDIILICIGIIAFLQAIVCFFMYYQGMKKAEADARYYRDRERIFREEEAHNAKLREIFPQDQANAIVDYVHAVIRLAQL